jgi:hypothetical protein
MRRVALGFLLLAAACAKPSVAELAAAGHQALGRSDFATALECFHEAAELAGPGTDAFVANRLAECEAWCGVDGARAAREFLALAQDHPAGVGQREYVSLITKLSAGRRYDAATSVLQAGLERFPGDAKLDELGHALAQAAANAGNEDALGDLADLGYLGK